jgi:broad specificity phosphatase PhoE
MSLLYMIRHGRPSADWSAQTDPDPGLDEAGKAQAEAAADRLLSLPPDRRPNCVYSSPLRRCRETAAPFAARIGVSVVVDPRFGEIPTPSALSSDERSPWLAAAFKGRWSDVRGDIDYDGWRRAVGAALGELSSAAVFSHFVAINAALSCATGDEQVVIFRPDHASITTFERAGERLRLVERGPEAATQVL